MLREAREDDVPGMQRHAGSARGEEGGDIGVITVRECAMADREGMSSGGPQGGMDCRTSRLSFLQQNPPPRDPGRRWDGLYDLEEPGFRMRTPWPFPAFGPREPTVRSQPRRLSGGYRSAGRVSLRARIRGQKLAASPADATAIGPVRGEGFEPSNSFETGP